MLHLFVNQIENSEAAAYYAPLSLLINVCVTDLRLKRVRFHQKQSAGENPPYWKLVHTIWLVRRPIYPDFLN